MKAKANRNKRNAHPSSDFIAVLSTPNVQKVAPYPKLKNTHCHAEPCNYKGRSKAISQIQLERRVVYNCAFCSFGSHRICMIVSRNNLYCPQCYAEKEANAKIQRESKRLKT